MSEPAFVEDEKLEMMVEAKMVVKSDRKSDRKAIVVEVMFSLCSLFRYGRVSA